MLDKARFVFRYPKNRQANAFLQQYRLVDKLGKGHFAEVYLCIEKSTGQRYAVKVFTKTSPDDISKDGGLQQEIAMLMGVSHPNVLCIKDTFSEPNAVYLVLELAPEGELFNYIVNEKSLSETQCRKLFTQLFQGVKYLVSLIVRPLATCHKLTTCAARPQYSSSGHQTREHSVGGQEPKRQAR